MSDMLKNPLFPKFLFKDKWHIGKSNRGDTTCFFTSFSNKRESALWQNFPMSDAWYPKNVIPFKKCQAKLPTAIERIESPTYNEWEKMLQARAVDKVVMGRMVTYIFAEPLDPSALISMLYETNDQVFAYLPDEKTAFIGATPEALFRRKGNRVFTEAVAGTHTDKEFLLNSEKDLREFLYVQEFLIEQLKLVATNVTTSKISIKQSKNVFHLHSTLSATLNDDVTNQDLIALLHPTPAMGGMPRAEALSQIEQLEPFDRGLYAAPIGIMTDDFAEVLVAIRSALVQENRLHLFSGAGIVEGSDPEKEWEELNKKIHRYVEHI